MRRSRNGPPTLTARQRDVLELIARGHSNREIASRLQLSENGVKAHVARLLVKFSVPNRAALVRAALPGRGESDASGPDLYLLLKETLSDVVGPTATEALLRRAVRRATTLAPQIDALAPERSEGEPPVGHRSEDEHVSVGMRAILRELWPLLIDMTGPVVVGRLERQGLVPDAEPRAGGPM